MNPPSTVMATTHNSSDDDDDDDDLSAPTKEKPDLDEIKKTLYQKECTKLGIIPVGAVLRSPSQADVCLRFYGLGPVGAGALSVPLMLDSAMTRLDLEGNALGDDGLANMMEMLLEHCSLTHLNLNDNNLSTRGAAVICRILDSNKLLVRVSLAANWFVDTDGLIFANMLKGNKTLRELNLSKNKFGQQAGKYLGDALSLNESLEMLDLSWNQFRAAGAAKLLEGVKNNFGLKTLVLAFNAFNRGLCSGSADLLGPAIAANCSLRGLDVSSNRLSDLDIIKIAKSLKVNEILETLKIGQNLVSYRAAGVVAKAILLNESSGIKLLDMTDLPLAEADIHDIEALRSRNVKVIHGRIHQKETSFEPDVTRKASKGDKQKVRKKT